MVQTMPKSWNKESKPTKFCPGCGHGITFKQLGFAIDELNIATNTTLGIDIGCSLLAWNLLNVNTVQTHHGRTTATMVGYKTIRPKRIAIAYMGDGGGYAIGLQSLIYAAFRNDPILVILVNNGNYGMTGGQEAPTTLQGEVTPTSPSGAPEFGSGFKGPELVASVAHEKAFVARATVSKPLVLKSTIRKAIENQTKNNSFSFIEVLSICPTNWKMNAKQCSEKIDIMEKFFPIGILKGDE